MTPLVSTDWLESELGAPDLRLIESTVRIVTRPDGSIDGESGREVFEREHIEGAQFIDLAQDVSDRDSEMRFMVPSPEQFTAAMQDVGVGSDCRVVVYSATDMFWATRLWWLLKVFGHDQVAVLDGGLAKWRAEGRSLSDRVDSAGPAVFEARPDYSLVADKDDILAIAQATSRAAELVDILPADHYRGDTESAYGYARAGHIAGAVNIPMDTLIDPADGTLLPQTELVAALDPALSAESAPIFYCGGGIAATQGAFAMAVIGKPSRVYDASLQEWALDPALPMITGPQTR